MNESGKETTKGVIFGTGLVILTCSTVVGFSYALHLLFVMLRHQGIF
jgi:hypothetical protein